MDKSDVESPGPLDVERELDRAICRSRSYERTARLRRHDARGIHTPPRVAARRVERYSGYEVLGTGRRVLRVSRRAWLFEEWNEDVSRLRAGTARERTRRGNRRRRFRNRRFRPHVLCNVDGADSGRREADQAFCKHGLDGWASNPCYKLSKG